MRVIAVFLVLLAASRPGPVRSQDCASSRRPLSHARTPDFKQLPRSSISNSKGLLYCKSKRERAFSRPYTVHRRCRGARQEIIVTQGSDDGASVKPTGDLRCKGHAIAIASPGEVKGVMWSGCHIPEGAYESTCHRERCHKHALVQGFQKSRTLDGYEATHVGADCDVQTRLCLSLRLPHNPSPPTPLPIPTSPPTARTLYQSQAKDPSLQPCWTPSKQHFAHFHHDLLLPSQGTPITSLI